MRGLVSVVLCMAFASIVLAHPQVDLYTDEFDSLDHTEVFKSERLYKNYLACFETGEKCTPVGKKIREIFPDALQTECSKCTKTQKEKGDEIIRWIIENKTQDYLRLEKIHDPEHKYRTKYADKLKELNIELPPYIE